MKNLTQLRDELTATFKNLKDGSLDVAQAAEMNNTAGKIISTVKVELEYAALRKEAPTIAFLADTKAKAKD